MYLPQSYCDQFFMLGSKYQQSAITPAAVLEVSSTLAQEISESLLLDHPITPLQFLANDVASSDTEKSEGSEESEESEESD